MHDHERSQTVDQENALLVRVIMPNDSVSGEPLDELAGLAETVGVVIVGGITQKRQKLDSSSCLGKGKLEELHQLVETCNADVVIFDNDLTPSQTRNLEKTLKVKVIDRTELIQDIFASNARTYESRLAVELAQLEYSLPRLKRMWTHLSRYSMGVGMRGPGEKQLEIDRRLVEKRIYDLRSEIKTIEHRKERQVSARQDQMTVSLVGYTNSGKSTLMNSLTAAGVTAENKLFATLDTRTRRWQLPSWGPVLLSDTVGFIRDLPHRLITSFKATLEETRQANLLLHVADASNPSALEQISAVSEVLHELGIDSKDTVLVANKIDLCTQKQHLETLLRRYPNAVPISARTKEGFDRLAKTVSDALSRTFHDVDVETGVENGKLMAYLAAHGEILSKRFHETRVTIHCRLPGKHLGRIAGPAVTVRQHQIEHPDDNGPHVDSSAEDIA